MHKYLIFRTDRIGDFIFSNILINSIKAKNKNNIIDIVCSTYNHDYIKRFNNIRKLYILDKKRFYSNVENIFKINKTNYDYIIILDAKNRSIFFSFFLKAKFKITLIKNFKPIFLINFFFNKYLFNSEINIQLTNFTTLANYLNLQIPNRLEYFKNYNIAKCKYLSLTNNCVLLHLDEKWFKGYYHSDFTYMDINIHNFNLLINIISSKFKKKIVITTGKIEIKNLNEIIEVHFYKKKDNIYYSKKNKRNIIFIKNTTFNEIESIVKSSSLIICCEGAISHVSNAFNIKTLALVEKKFSKTVRHWTGHMKNINYIYRNSLKLVCNEIYNIKI